MESRWTERAIQMLRELKGTMSGTAIANEISRTLGIVFSRSAIMGKAFRLGLSVRLTPEQLSVRAPRKAASRRRGGRAPWNIKIHDRSFVGPEYKTDRLAVHILDLSDHQCRFVLGQPSDLMFCGQPAVGATSWCMHHLSIVAQPRP